MGVSPACQDCGSTDRVRLVRPRRSWGNAGQTYHPPELWCMKCCKKRPGQYALVTRIKTTYHTKAEIEHPVRRAGGDCLCDVCGKDYYHHPRHVYSNYPNGRNEFGPDNMALVLIETCKGEKYKL